mmetsp:Transcript_70353/g.150664  ORF Transcript_70353/g.150664 Transcript_70353/m.150664 type:complete len:86 (-) Transcript_70353:17-274(-)
MAAMEQYSQFWVQQQLNAQMALYKTEKEIATTKLPEVIHDKMKDRDTPMPVTRYPGDWICSKCKDLQFSRNRICRFCGAPRPTDK